MLLLVVCALFAAAAAYPQRNYGVPDLYQYLLLSSPLLNSFLCDVQKAEVEFQKRCEMYGGEDAYGNLMIVVESSEMEFSSAMFTEMEIDLNNGDMPDVGFYCRLSQTLKKGLENIINAGKNCTSPLERDQLSEAINITGSTLDYICFNGGERITSFVEDGGRQCLVKIRRNLIDCLNESIGSSPFSMDEPKNLEDVKKNREQECRVKLQIEFCVKRHFSECQNPTATTFVDGFLDTIISPSCKKQSKYPLNIIPDIPFAQG